MAGAPSHEGESSGKENDVKLSLRSSLYPVKWVPRLGKNRQKNDVYQMPDGVAPLTEAWAPLLAFPHFQSLFSDPPDPLLPTFGWEGRAGRPSLLGSLHVTKMRQVHQEHAGEWVDQPGLGLKATWGWAPASPGGAAEGSGASGEEEAQLGHR